MVPENTATFSEWWLLLLFAERKGWEPQTPRCLWVGTFIQSLCKCGARACFVPVTECPPIQKQIDAYLLPPTSS